MTTAPAPLYSPAQLAHLAARYGIDTDAGRAAMAMQLERAGHHYLAMRGAEHLAAEDAAFRAELQTMADAAQHLAVVLAALSPRAVEALDIAADTAAARAVMTPLPDFGAAVFTEGAAILPGTMPESFQPIGWNAAWTASVAAGMAANARRAIGTAAQRPGRVSGLHSLRVWAENMRGLWQDMLGKPFTFDTHNGGAITPASAFCVDALAILDPKASPTALQTAIRHVRTEARKRAKAATGNNTPPT